MVVRPASVLLKGVIIVIILFIPIEPPMIFIGVLVVVTRIVLLKEAILVSLRGLLTRVPSILSIVWIAIIVVVVVFGGFLPITLMAVVNLLFLRSVVFLLIVMTVRGLQLTSGCVRLASGVPWHIELLATCSNEVIRPRAARDVGFNVVGFGLILALVRFSSRCRLLSYSVLVSC